MKRIIGLILMALPLTSCGVSGEQDKLCKFMHTCDGPDAPPEPGIERPASESHE